MPLYIWQNGHIADKTTTADGRPLPPNSYAEIRPEWIEFAQRVKTFGAALYPKAKSRLQYRWASVTQDILRDIIALMHDLRPRSSPRSELYDPRMFTKEQFAFYIQTMMDILNYSNADAVKLLDFYSEALY